MRVIAGVAKGTKLRAPQAGSRPTADRVREAIFSILGERVPGAAVLDLYAGSGALGIEALSRGAASAVFVEGDRRAAGVIETNLGAAHLSNGSVHVVLVKRFLRDGGKGAGPFDLVFADPPYWKREGDEDHIGQLLVAKGFCDMIAADGVLVLEGRRGTRDVVTDGWQVIDRRGYGETEVLFLKEKKS
ncbi:MAG: 16S rRNA (guanine(966)-N(2))-methyltransferase RsmD [Verrucomicrobiota bacterium]